MENKIKFLIFMTLLAINGILLLFCGLYNQISVYLISFSSLFSSIITLRLNLHPIKDLKETW